MCGWGGGRGGGESLYVCVGVGVCERERERENSNLKTLFYKDCRLRERDSSGFHPAEYLAD